MAVQRAPKTKELTWGTDEQAEWKSLARRAAVRRGLKVGIPTLAVGIAATEGAQYLTTQSFGVSLPSLLVGLAGSGVTLMGAYVLHNNTLNANQLFAHKASADHWKGQHDQQVYQRKANAYGRWSWRRAHAAGKTAAQEEHKKIQAAEERGATLAKQNGHQSIFSRGPWA